MHLPHPSDPDRQPMKAGEVVTGPWTGSRQDEWGEPPGSPPPTITLPPPNNGGPRGGDSGVGIAALAFATLVLGYKAMRG